MSSSLTPSKRPNDGNLMEQNGKRKAQNSASKSPGKPSKSSAGTLGFRVLFPASKTDTIVGESGGFLFKIWEEAGSKVLLEEPVPGCDERVITITIADGEYGRGSEPSHVEVNGDEGTKEHGKDVENKKAPEEESKARVDGTSLQKALLLVFEKLVEGESATENGNGDSNKYAPCVLRLLVLSSQIGCLLGKAGSVIKQMSTSSGAEIRILPKDKLPPLASASDELVQITGEVDAVRKALQSISQKLIENSTRDKEAFPANPSGLSSHSSGNSLSSRKETHRASKNLATQKTTLFPSRPHGIDDIHPHIPHPISRFHKTDLHNRMKPFPEMLSFRLLCNSDRVGGIIGKAGAMVNIIQQETGCEIRVMEGPSELEDRIIVISGPAHPEDRVSAVQDALLRVHNRILRATDNKDSSVMARILVSSNQVGCILGKGGSIIAEMRKSSGAHIRILGKDQIPKCASEDEEVVHVNGGYDEVQEALLQITDRLKLLFFRDVFPLMEIPPNPALFDPVPPLPSFMRRRKLSPPPRIHPNFGPSIHKFDPVHAHDDRPLVRDIFRPAPPLHMPERMPWASEGPIIDDGGPFGFHDFPGGPPRRPAGFVGGPAIITNTTVEVVVPRSVVPSIYGEDGWSLNQIRMISDARVTIADAKPEARETVITISGTPEQTHAAQSLIQAFVLLENEEPL